MSEQIKPLEQLYCIAGIAAASQSFARGGEESQKKLISEMKEKHIDESANLIRESDLSEILSGKCAPHCFPLLWNNLMAKYTELGYAFTENCLRCDVACT